jgi:peptidoglycan-N-acetylglucosamine deacetylase
MRSFHALMGAIGLAACIAPAAAGECPGNPEAIGTSRVLQVDAAASLPIGTAQYERTLPLADHEVALTFDDGPSDRMTPRILDSLAKDCVKATFFMVGRMVSASPGLAKRALLEGHAIGTHTQNHPLHMHRFSALQLQMEIDVGLASLEKALGDANAVAPFFRIPGLDRSRAIEAYAKSRGLMVWSIDIDTDDWTHISPSEVVTHGMNELKRRRKGVILMHDIHERTAQALPELLKQLKAGGYHVVQVVPVRDGSGHAHARDEARAERAERAEPFLVARPKDGAEEEWQVQTDGWPR